MIEQNMRSWLSSSTGTSTCEFYLREAIGSAASPYGVIFKVSPGKDYTHDYLNATSKLSVSRMQCSCFSTVGYLSAKNMAVSVIDAMEVWPTKSTTPTSTGVQTVFLEGETDLYEDDTKTHHVALDFFVWHTQ